MRISDWSSDVCSSDLPHPRPPVVGTAPRPASLNEGILDHMAQQDAPAEVLTTIKSIGVIGAGQMGSGIAHVCALAGYDVRLSDISAEPAQKALDVIAKNMDRQVQAIATDSFFKAMGTNDRN